MKKSTTLVLGACFAITMASPGLFGQGRQRQAPTVGQVRPPITRDQREDVRDRREDVRDRREDVRDRRENVLDRREDVRDAQRDGGVLDRREDVRDRREDVLDRREDVRDRREDVRDRFEDRIDHNPRFAARLHGLLPPDTKPGEAISGFKNEGQFFATLHASKNLNIPFNQLKDEMTGDDNLSLGQAIHQLRPDLPERSIQDSVRKAEQQAKETDESE
jgi:hypothetical protein